MIDQIKSAEIGCSESLASTPMPGLVALYGLPGSKGSMFDSLRLKRLEDELSRVRSAVVCTLVTLLDLKDLVTGVHSTRLASLAVRVGKQLGLSELVLHDVEVAALLHDVGKIGISDAVLLKPSALSRDEFRTVQRHPELGWGALRVIPGFEQVALYVLYHHERIDGRGYPAGLEGSEIPRGARIVAVVDAFDAMTSPRSYRRAVSVVEAIRRLETDRGTQFDAEIVDLFVEMLRSDFPVLNRQVDG